MDGTEDEETATERTGGKQNGSSKDALDTEVASKDTTVGSVYSGAKIRHIKKEDGTPLWRKEIQYEFLRLVVEDKTPAFTRFSDKKPGCNFADIYIDCLVHSTKTSKVLKDRLLKDREAGENMAMICLLVNVGRMNTTLNFFPEMRAQLRTYHSIPSLQAYASQKDYKSLQDAPRLKSILKGASEDDNGQPKAMQALEEDPPPARTNAVNCIFILSNFATRISDAHLADKVDWFDLAMRPTISSKSRARAFLWIMWWYLEAEHTAKSALENPFGPGQYHPSDDPSLPGAFPCITPPLEFITEEEGDKENEDPPIEKEFAETMTKKRKEIMDSVANEPTLTMADPNNPVPENKSVKRLRTKKSLPASVDEDSTIMSDVDSRASPGLGRSPAPPELLAGSAFQADSLDDDFEQHEPHPGKGRYKRVRGKNTPSRAKPATAVQNPSRRRAGTPDTRSTPQPPPGGHVIMSQYGVPRTEPLGIPSKPRARTGYQRELEDHKQKRVEWALRRRRKNMLASPIFNQDTRLILRTARRVQNLEPTYDSEEEVDRATKTPAIGGLTHRTPGGLDRPFRAPPGFDINKYDAEDWGGEAESWLKATTRMRRRLDVWDGDRDVRIRRDILNHNVTAKHMPYKVPGSAAAPAQRANPRSKQEMDAQIEEDLLAERSDNDEDMADENTPMMDEDADGLDGDLEDSDVPMD
ncbi:Ino eighty subunit 1 [Cyphellophora attinorum]|uniref:Ino eighty subunit 1 n=1 Tax=Cyphellophora attinorum TaxID=1664694 RepID=A0A0N1HIB0_9EURO|nr:Ino eighty subunit 1 [Phialophora attinorum]KPI46024.1 Ino eighty subunit 1 [Phialophora attinorum]